MERWLRHAAECIARSYTVHVYPFLARPHVNAT